MLHRLPFRAMGGEMIAILEADSDSPPAILDEIPGWFEEWEQAFSRFRIDSELSRLNQTFDQPVEVSEPFWDVFQYAISASNITNGLVTPTVLDAVVEAGYYQNFDDLPRYQNSYGHPVMTLVNPLSQIVWDEANRTICLPYGVRLDFGGVAKGWSAHQTVERLQEYGPALMNAAGDIAIGDMLKSGDEWQVGVKNPFDRSTDFEVLKLSRCGVATSGKDRRRWSQNGSLRHHIIDPKTGLPAETDVLAATIIAPTATEAEAAAKAVLIMGAEDGLKWIEDDSTLAGIIVLEDGRALYSQRISNYL